MICQVSRENDRYMVGDCFSLTGMKPNALCGCVAGRCTFFVPSPENSGRAATPDAK